MLKEKNEWSSQESQWKSFHREEKERRDGRKEKKKKKKKLPHHNHAANWFSAVNLCSVFGQAISKTGEHEMISQHIYLDKSRGC